MNSNSNVTVVIPCYNDGKYIMKALNSVLNQTLKPEKIIIIDDGSDKETKTILEKIKNKDVEVIFQSNAGVCKTRNKGISLAKTDYILNLDADDFFEPSFIEKAVTILNSKPNVGVVGCYYKTFNKHAVNKGIMKPLGGDVKNFMVKNNAMNCSLYRKECWEKISGYDENMVQGYEDWDFWISILKNGWKMHIIKEPLFYYRIKNTSRDNKALVNYDFELRSYIFEKHKQLYFNNFDTFVSQILYKNSKIKLTQLKTKNSIDYKLGNYILFPFRLIKRILNL